MKRKLIAYFLFSSILGYAQQNQTHETIGALEYALKAKDYSLIKSYLADNFVYNSYEGHTALSIMSQIVGGYPLKLERIRIKSAFKVGNDNVITCEFITPEGQENEEHQITLSSDYKIIRADVVNIQVAPQHSSGGSANTNSPSSKIEKHLPDEVSFKGNVDDGLFYVQAQLNGQDQSFFFDTGAGINVVVNSDFLDIASKSEAHSPQGSTGSIAMKSIELKQFALDKIVWKNFGASSMALSHLGEKAGLIGSEFLKDYLLVLDYKEEKISMYKLDRAGATNENKIAGFEKINSYKIGHLPIIEVEIDGEKYFLAVDTGANKLMMDKKYFDKLSSVVSLSKEKGHLKGAGQEEVEVEKGILSGLKINNHLFTDVNIIFNEQPRYSHGDYRVDGIIGYDILKEGQFALNLETGEVYFKI